MRPFSALLSPLRANPGTKEPPMHWNKEESLSRQELTKLQGERLQRVCERVYSRVPFYKRK